VAICQHLHLCASAGYSEGLWHQAAASLSNAKFQLQALLIFVDLTAEIIEKSWSKGAKMM